MDNYEFLRQAVLEHASVTGRYDGLVRRFSPHSIGQDNAGHTNVLAFQYAGESPGPLPEWRCFRVDGLSELRRNGERWHTRANFVNQDTCVTRPGAVAYERADSTPV